MNDNDILRHIDHSLLAANAAEGDILRVCEEAEKYGTASVCIPPSYVETARKHYPSLNICTVVGFPLGYSKTSVKLAEAQAALADGCDEIDMVIDITRAINGDFDSITDEIAALKRAVGEKVLKVILETCYLTQESKIALCKCVTDGGADYIKTSTGFGPAGASLEDIALFKKHVGPDIKVKAAGGVRTREDMEAYLAAGCDRIGTSGAIKALSPKN